jgi:hypothetical protein
MRLNEVPGLAGLEKPLEGIGVSDVRFGETEDGRWVGVILLDVDVWSLRPRGSLSEIRGVAEELLRSYVATSRRLQRDYPTVGDANDEAVRRAYKVLTRRAVDDRLQLLRSLSAAQGRE